MRKIIILALLTTGCATSYRQSEEYKIKQRQKQSMEMYELTHKVRKKCAPRRNRPGRAHRKRYYS